MQNETQEEAHLETEMKLLWSLARMRQFPLSPCTKGEYYLQESVALNCQWVHSASPEKTKDVRPSVQGQLDAEKQACWRLRYVKDTVRGAICAHGKSVPKVPA